MSKGGTSNVQLCGAGGGAWEPSRMVRAGRKACYGIDWHDPFSLLIAFDRAIDSGGANHVHDR